MQTMTPLPNSDTMQNVLTFLQSFGDKQSVSDLLTQVKAKLDEEKQVAADNVVVAADLATRSDAVVADEAEIATAQAALKYDQEQLLAGQQQVSDRMKSLDDREAQLSWSLSDLDRAKVDFATQQTTAEEVLTAREEAAVLHEDKIIHALAAVRNGVDTLQTDAKAFHEALDTLEF